MKSVKGCARARSCESRRRTTDSGNDDALDALMAACPAVAESVKATKALARGFMTTYSSLDGSAI
jgi:hypothetical protein